MNEHLKPDEIDWENADTTASIYVDDACLNSVVLAKVLGDLTAERNLARAYLALQARLANERAKLAIAMDALRGIEEYWNRNPNERAMQDACDHAVETASTALATINELEKQSCTKPTR